MDRYTRDTLEASVLNGLQQASYGARTVQRFLRGICVGSKQGRIAARVSIEAAETEEKRSTANLKGFSIFTSKEALTVDRVKERGKARSAQERAERFPRRR
ncbi:hypothetical protein ACQTO0_00045 [Brucella sp. NF 2815]|uniref:hypothetical protein n=1 Tax=Brucella sp. NF 2815 TaxID=3419592 RepID=UPI003D180814